MRRYLAPHPKYRHLEDRVDFAASYMSGDYSGSGCASTHTTYVSGNIEVISECLGGLGSIRPVARPARALASSGTVEDQTVSDGFDFCEIEVSDPFANAITLAMKPS
jgi:hypothetical protein